MRKISHESFLAFIDSKLKHFQFITEDYAEINYTISTCSFGNKQEKKLIKLKEQDFSSFEKIFSFLEDDSKFMFIVKISDDYYKIKLYFVANINDVVFVPLSEQKYKFLDLLDKIEIGEYSPIFLSTISRKEYDDKCEEEISQLVGTLNDIKIATEIIKKKYNNLYNKANKLYLQDHFQKEHLGKLRSKLEEIFKTSSNRKNDELWNECLDSNYISSTNFLLELCLKYERLVQLIK